MSFIERFRVVTCVYSLLQHNKCSQKEIIDHVQTHQNISIGNRRAFYKIMSDVELAYRCTMLYNKTDNVYYIKHI